MAEQHAAVLIAGSENRFVSSVTKMNEYLQGLNVPTSIHASAPTDEILRAIRVMGGCVSEAGVLLIVVDAHGSKTGIESPGFMSLTYKKIVKAIPTKCRRVQFVTSTCYGQFLIKYLIGVRCGVTTGVITTWEGFRTTYDSTIKDVREAWTLGMLPEKHIGRQLYTDENTFDSEFLGVQRWGAIHDSYFFAPQ